MTPESRVSQPGCTDSVLRAHADGDAATGSRLVESSSGGARRSRPQRWTHTAGAGFWRVLAAGGYDIAAMNFPEMYEQELVRPLFQPFAERIVEDVRLTAGNRVLDVACGTGIVARLAKERLGDSGRVVGVDLSPLMLGVARRVAPSIEWREGDAAALPLREGEQFDVVFCQQGVQFFPDRRRALEQMHRALAPGGRVAVSTWRPDEEFPLLRELRRVAERHVGPVADRRHSLGDAGLLETLLREAGFREVTSKTVSRTIRFRDGMVFVRLNAMALVGMSAKAKEMGDGERERVAAAIVRDSAGSLGPDTDAAGLSFELATNMVRGKC